MLISRNLILSTFIFSSLSLASAESTAHATGVSKLEFCSLAVSMAHTRLRGLFYVDPKPMPYVPVDLPAFLGKPLPWGLQWASHIAPLLPPALHANVLYRRILKEMSKPENADKDLLQVAEEVMGHEVKVSAEELELIPQKGSFLMISNHPTGVLDGVVDAEVLRRRGRDDFSIIVAHFLKISMSAHPELIDRFIYVDRRHRKFEDKASEDLSPDEIRILSEANALNRQELKRMLRLKKEGQVIILYPTGSIASQIPHPDHPVTYDGEWDPTTVTMARSMGVIVPTFKVTRNSDRYLELKKQSVTASRRAYFAEALNKQDEVVEVIVGKSFTWNEVEEAVPQRPGVDPEQIDRERLAFIRAKVDALDPYGLAPQYAQPTRR